MSIKKDSRTFGNSPERKGSLPKVRVVPFASPLNAGEETAVQERAEGYFAALRQIEGFEFEMAPMDSAPGSCCGRGTGRDADAANSGVAAGERPHDPDITLVLALGGGIEEKVLKFVPSIDGPVLMLAHPANNGLAAAIEILSFLNLEGRDGRIVQAVEGWQKRLSDLLHVFAARARMRRARLGVVGVRNIEVMEPWRLAGRVKEVWGSELVYLELSELIDLIETADVEEAREAAREFRQNAAAVVEPDEETFLGAAKAYVGLRNLVERHHLDGVTVKCFDLLPVLHNTGCYALARLNEEGIPAACEADVLSALGMLFVRELTGRPSFMANPSKIDEDSGTVTFAHCTIARNMLSTYTVRSHFESGIGVGIQGQIPGGPLTVVRLGGPDLKDVFAEPATLLASGARHDMCRTQLDVKFHDPGAARAILERPLGNHHLILLGEWENRIREYQALFIG